jgi:HK97 family phage prohead protease
VADKKQTFVLNDETKVNTYGFRLLNSGGNLERFKSNPVMLYAHNNYGFPVGKWENLRIDGSKLLADAVFDMEDEEAKKIAGKVERGFLSGVSAGIRINRMEESDKESIATEWELMEASIVSIPSNANAVKLYAENGVELSADDIIKLCINSNSKTMSEKEKTEQPAKIAELEKANAELQAQLAAIQAASKETEEKEKTEQAAKVAELEKANAELQAQLAAAHTAEIDTYLSVSEKSGKINTAEKAGFAELAATNFESVKKVIDARPEKAGVSLHAMTETASTTVGSVWEARMKEIRGESK